MLSDTQIPQVIGASVFTHNGDRIGTVEHVYVDVETREPVVATVHTGLFGQQENVVPIAQASFTDGHVAIPYGTSILTEAPKVDPDRSPDQQVVEDLHRHFNLGESNDAGTHMQLSPWEQR